MPKAPTPAVGLTYVVRSDHPQTRQHDGHHVVVLKNLAAVPMSMVRDDQGREFALAHDAIRPVR